MIVALDHIAIAVPDLAAAIKRFMDDFGIDLAGTEDVAAAKTTTAFFPIDGTSIELVHPLNGEGPIAGYLEKRGGGLHHICFRLRAREDVDTLHDFLLTLGAEIVHPPQEDGWAPGYYSVLFEDPDGIRLEANFVPGKGLLA